MMTKAAQNAGGASCGCPLSMSDNIERLRASARPTVESSVISRMATVTSLIVASELTAQYETSTLNEISSNVDRWFHGGSGARAG